MLELASPCQARGFLLWNGEGLRHTASGADPELHAPWGLTGKACLRQHKAARMRALQVDRGMPPVVEILKLLRLGIGVHHSGLLPILKELVELLFQEQLIKVAGDFYFFIFVGGVHGIPHRGVFGGGLACSAAVGAAGGGAPITLPGPACSGCLPPVLPPHVAQRPVPLP